MRVYLRILKYGRRFKANAVFAGLFLLLQNLFGVISLTLIIPFLQILFNETQTPKPGSAPEISNLKDWLMFRLGEAINSAGAEGKFNLLFSVCGFLLVTILLKNLFRYLASWNIGPLEQGVVNEMRKKLFSHLSRLSMNFFTGRKKGEIINVLVSDVQVIQESVIGTLQNIINDPLTMGFILTAMLILSWKLTLFTLLVLPLSGFAISRISKGLKRKARQGQESLGKLVSLVDEFIGGIRIVKAFGAEQFEAERYKELNDAYQRQMVSLKRKSDLASPLTEVLSLFVVVGIILYGGNLILNAEGELQASAFIGFVALFSQFLAPIKTFSSAVSRIQRGVVSFQRVEEFLKEEEQVKENKNPIGLDNFRESIRFEHVSFNYGAEDVLSDINLEIPKGQTIALVGHSGAGKSTIADLLPRFYDPVEGRILIDGNDLRQLKVKDLRGLFGVVSQEGILFNDSILNNIAYGDPNPDKKRIEEAAKIANAHEFIGGLPNGYLTIIGERGTRLSGGQRQRLSIARALYRNPAILILDEATSSLDSESEKLVQDALEKLMAGRTALIIAHRLSTITRADRIVVVEKGKITETGKHEELLKKGGSYRGLFENQFRETV